MKLPCAEGVRFWAHPNIYQFGVTRENLNRPPPGWEGWLPEQANRERPRGGGIGEGAGADWRGNAALREEVERMRQEMQELRQMVREMQKRQQAGPQ